MKIQYQFDGETFTNSYKLRQKLWEKKGVIVRMPTENKAEFWEAFGVTYTETPDPEPTPEEIAAQELEEAKRVRARQVAAIKVEVDGMTFDGDETSQSRMARALEVASITGMESTVWVLADNTVAEVTVAQMQQALSKAMLEMGELWTVPYEEQKVDQNLDLPQVGI